MEYCAPGTLAEVCAVLGTASGPVRVLAGGTDLLPRFVAGTQLPGLLIDIKRVPEAREIRRLADGSFIIGSACSGNMISAHAELVACWPGLTEAMDLIGSVQIQSRATLGGNLCNASPAADAVPALIAARARCRIAGSDGERELPVEDVIVSPGRTCLRQDEFIVSFYLPARATRSADAYLRMTPRTEMDIAIASAAVNLTVDDSGVVSECHVVLGAVGPVPVYALPAARILLGTKLDEEVLQRFRRQVSASCRPISDKRGSAEYRTDVTAVLAERAALMAYNRIVI